MRDTLGVSRILSRFFQIHNNAVYLKANVSPIIKFMRIFNWRAYHLYSRSCVSQAALLFVTCKIIQ